MDDIDKEQLGDPYANAEYAKEIFEYMRSREVGDVWHGDGSPVWECSDHVGRATHCLEALSTWWGPAGVTKRLV